MTTVHSCIAAALRAAPAHVAASLAWMGRLCLGRGDMVAAAQPSAPSSTGVETLTMLAGSTICWL